MRERLTAAGAEPAATTPAELAAFLKSEWDKWLRVTQQAGIYQSHSAIYFLIAGTYTPFTLGVLRGAWGWTLFGLVWGLAVAGTLVKAFGGFAIHRDVDMGLSRDGVADPARGRHGVGSVAEVGSHLALCRRRRLHRGRGFFPGRANQILSFRMAPCW